LITFTFARSSGPGGQNVNKGKLSSSIYLFLIDEITNIFIILVNTKVDMRFNLNEAKWIPEYARKKLAIQVNFNLINLINLIIYLFKQY